jgi:hypothetical protein
VVEDELTIRPAAAASDEAPMTDDHLKPLRDALIRCCENYKADGAKFAVVG